MLQPHLLMNSSFNCVTRHASTPLVDEFQFQLCGIDSLDLGLYVIWGSDWKQRLRTLDKKKQQSRKQGGLLINLPSGRICNFRPNGKGENYRFHLCLLYTSPSPR